MVDQPAGESFGVEVSKHDGVVILTVRGALDVISAPRLSTVGASAAALASNGLVIDLTAVSLLSSSGLTALLRTVDGLPAGTSAALVAPHPGVHRPITLSGLDLVITTEVDLDAAIRAVL